MKKVVFALAAVLAVAFVAPLSTAQAENTKVVIKRGHGHGHHFGMREHHGGKKVVIIKHRRHREM